MASDALWIVSFKCIVKGYQECRFDVKDGEVFRVSIMAVRCSQTSNILTLVDLLLSCSLLIVQDEFERIMYIVSKIFFIIIHLLYAVACIAVSNLLVFLHKSNPSSCLAAIVS